VTMKSAGEAFYGQQDQAVREVWGEWGSGPWKVRTTLAERWNNVNRDPFRPRITTTEQRTALTLQPEGGPAFTVSYAHAASASSLEPAGTAATRNLSDTLEASVAVMRAGWNAKLFSAYSLVSDRLGDADTAGLTHGLQASYRPTTLVTIAPSLSFREDRQRWSGGLIDTPSASLSLTYAPRQAMTLTAFGLYTRAHSTDGLVNTSTYNLKSVLTWTTFQTAGLTTAISFDAGYTAALDEAPAGRSTEDLSGLVRVQLVNY
ncbi:MAG TPA: hypothetical protein VFA38_02280, partial [Nitrospirales bacterium]|nr:hypothetical protein [Nitrospirales bacterium]